MGILDLSPAAEAADNSRITQTSGGDLPAEFGDTFDAAWSEGRLFGQSIAHDNARMAVLDDYLGEIQQKTGRRIDLAEEMKGQPYETALPFDAANNVVRKMKADYPDLDLEPLSDDEIENRAVAKSRQARADYAAMQQRETTFGGKVGTFLGGAAAAAADPVNLVALPIAPEAELGVLASALRWAAIGGISQTAIEGLAAPYREQVAPGYLESPEPLMNVLGAAGGAAVLGGGFKAIGKAWTAVKGRYWPESVRDAGNIVESETQAAQSNVLPGPEGEAAHRSALSSAIDSVVAGEPVNVEAVVAGKPNVVKGDLNEFSGLPEGTVKHGFGDSFKTPIHDIAGREVGFIEYSIDPNTVGVRSVFIDEEGRGQGLGIAAYRQIADWALANGRELISDSDVSPMAVRVYEGLERRGYSVVWPDKERTPPEDRIRVVAGPAEAPRLGLFGAHEAKIDGMMDERAAAGAARGQAAAERTEAATGGATFTFTTAKGSTYEHFADGTTSRDKAFRPEHGPSEQGPQPRSERTFYVSEADATALGEFQAQGGGRRAVAQLPDGRWGVKYLDGKDAGKFERRTVVSASDEPKAGMIPVELWKGGERVHFGNKITDVRPTNGQAELPFQATATEATAAMHEATLADGVQGMAQMAGYDMPREEAERISRMVAGMKSDDQARAILSEISARPQTVADHPPTAEPTAGAPQGDRFAEGKKALSDTLDKFDQGELSNTWVSVPEAGEGGHGIYLRKTPDQLTIANLRFEKKGTGAFKAYLEHLEQEAMRRGYPAGIEVENIENPRLANFLQQKRDYRVRRGGSQPTMYKTLNDIIDDAKRKMFVTAEEKPNIFGEGSPLTRKEPDAVARTLAEPAHQDAMRADIERAMLGDKPARIPIGVDADGEPVFHSVDAALAEVDGYKAAADQIAACAGPPQAEAAE